MTSAVASPRPKLLPGGLADWRRVLATHYTGLGRKSRQRRFLSSVHDRAVRMIADRASPDIVLGIEDDGRIVGVLEIFRGFDGHAEIGISVEDAYQGHGYGRALFRDGLAAAERLGVRTADLYFSCENTGIRKLIAAADGVIVRFGSECEAHIDIANFAACHDAIPVAPEDRAPAPRPRATKAV